MARKTMLDLPKDPEEVVMKNTGLLGKAARGLSGRKDRLDEIIDSATTPDHIVPVDKAIKRR